jgi:hypothetical protein
MATTKPSPSPAGTPTEIPAVMKPSPYTSPTPVPTLRGQYVGKLGWFSGCLTLSTDADGYIIFLPSAYRLDHPPAAYVIYDEMGDRVAHEGDVVGLNAKPAASSGSSCQLYAPALEVSEIVDDQPGSLTTDVDGWSVSCGLTSQSDCKRVAESFINQLGWDYLTVPRARAAISASITGLPVNSSCRIGPPDPAVGRSARRGRRQTHGSRFCPG